MTYYDRVAGVAEDGSPTFATFGDKTHEDDVQRMIESAWDCKLERFGHLAPVDWYAERYERMIGLVELKGSSRPIADCTHAWLNCRKWLALALGQAGFGVPSIFVVHWTDEARWIPLDKIDATFHFKAGCSRIVKAVSDQEPIVHVPIDQMKVLG